MAETNNLDAVRGATLDRIEKNERNYKLAFISAAVLEMSFLAGFALLADFSNRLHLLLLLATIATYSIIACGLLALGTHINQNTLRIIKAIESLDRN